MTKLHNDLFYFRTHVDHKSASLNFVSSIIGLNLFLMKPFYGETFVTLTEMLHRTYEIQDVLLLLLAWCRLSVGLHRGCRHGADQFQGWHVCMINMV